MFKGICVLLVFLGSCIMLASIITYIKTIKSYINYLTPDKSLILSRYTYITALMVFFLLGYWGNIFYILEMESVDGSILLIAIIFFFGAIFCFSVVFAQSDLLERLERSASGLREALEQSKNANASLDRLNQELLATMEELKRTQSQLVFSEKMSTLGKLVASISHEINTPIGVVKASAQTLHTSFSERFSHLFREIRQFSEEDLQECINYIETAVTNAGRYTTTSDIRALKREARQILEDKEGYNNTILDFLEKSYLLDYDTVRSVVPRLTSESFIMLLRLVSEIVSIITLIDNIAFSTEKVIKIVSSLKSFSHFNIISSKSKFNIIAGIETVLSIYVNQLKYDVEVITDFENVPNIIGYEDELSQVWNNLIQNAIYSMNENGNDSGNKVCRSKLIITVKNTEDSHILVSIADNGSGISPDKVTNIFEPFYTTKPTGIGTGIGLSISKQIIDKHNGDIWVDSEEGRGTTFTVSLPI